MEGVTRRMMSPLAVHTRVVVLAESEMSDGDGLFHSVHQSLLPSPACRESRFSSGKSDSATTVASSLTGVASSRASVFVRRGVLLLLVLVVLALFAFVGRRLSLTVGRRTHTRITDANLDRYFSEAAAREHDDREEHDVILPDEWVREYRLCEHDVATRQWDDDYEPGSLFWGGDTSQPKDHNAFLDPGQCATVEDVPSAHRVGRGGYPEIRLTLTEADLRTIYGVDGLDADNSADDLDPISSSRLRFLLLHLAPPLEVVIQVRAARFDPRRGEFVFTIWVERLYYDYRYKSGDLYAHTYFSFLEFGDRLKVRLWNYLFNRARRRPRPHHLGRVAEQSSTSLEPASPFECAFEALDGDVATHQTIARRIYASDGGESFAAFRLACPYPLHPARPPTTPFSLKLELRADDQWHPLADLPKTDQLLTAPIRGTADMRICSRVERRVTFAYCSAAVYNDRNLPTLRSYIRHHTYLGVQVFHLYVRYDPTPLRDLLAEEIRVGLVQLHPVPESIYFYLNGQPQPYAPYLDQHMHQFECQSNHHESAQYIVSADLDEYLYFPQEQHQQRHEDDGSAAASDDSTPPRPTQDSWHIDQYAATCLARTPSGVIYFTGRTNAESALSQSLQQLPPVYLLDPAAAAASPAPISPAIYASLTHMPLGCRSMMGDMLVQQGRPWSATHPNELPPGRLPSLASTPYPYPYLKTALPMNAPFALPFAMAIHVWQHRTEDGECTRRRVAAAEASARHTLAGGCSVTTSDWTPSAALRQPPVCPLMLRFPWPVAWPDVVSAPPKSLFRARADITFDIHVVKDVPSPDTDPHPQFQSHLAATAVRWVHFVSMHRSKLRYVSHLNESEVAAEAAFTHHDSSQSPFVHVHQRIMADIDRLPTVRTEGH